jgi:hypothetical protein
MNRVSELSFSYLDDSLDDAEAKELENLLRNDAEARRTFVKEVEFEVLLRMHFEEQPTEDNDSFTKNVIQRLHANDNRRDRTRYRLRYPEVKIQYRKKERALSLGVPQDISETGVCFVGTHGMNEGECVEVSVSFDEEEKSFRKKGRVVWVEREDEKSVAEQRTWKVGCRFLPGEDWEFQTALSKIADPEDLPTCSLCEE